MLRLTKNDRVRILAAVANRGAAYTLARTFVVTLSLAILLAVPLFKVVRIDLWGHEHYILGQRVGLIRGLQGFVIAMAILYGLTFISNMVVGRFFCGWGCPVGYVSRLGEDVATQKKKKGKWLHHLKGAAYVGTFVGAVMLWWVDPRVLLDGSWTARLVTAGVFLALAIGGFGHAFRWRFGFCLSLCPIGIYYRYVTSQAPIGIVFSEIPNPCIHCHACEKICPVNLDPKALGEEQHGDEDEGGDTRYGDAECLRCGDCIEACRMVFKADKDVIPPLRFGVPSRHETKPKASVLTAPDGSATIPPSAQSGEAVETIDASRTAEPQTAR